MPIGDAPLYRVKNDHMTINVLCPCSFNLKFTYVLSKWKGTVSESKILKDKISREDKLAVTEGKIFVVV